MLPLLPSYTRHGGARRCRLYSWLPLLAAGVAACHHSSGPTAATTGTIITTVEQPPGTKALAVIAGPTGSGIADFAFATVDTFALLPTGAYTMSDAQAIASDPIVTPSYTGKITGSPVTLNEADTAYMSATFTVVAGSGRAWIGSTNGGSPTSSGYTSTELTTQHAASTSLSVAGAYVAVDTSTNLWAADSAGNAISEYLAPSLGVSGAPSRAVTVTSTALSGPISLVFDRLNDLWISNAGNNTIVEFSGRQLAAGGSLTPAVILSSSALNAPGRMSFDVYGNLWVPNQGSNTVVAFSPSQLAASGAPTPAVTLSNSDSSLVGPRAVAFNEDGGLWVANATGNTIVEFASDQQVANGSPTPIEILSVPSAYGGPSTLAFDNSGDLWVLGTAGPNVIEYTGPQIAAGAANQPAYVAQVPSMPVSLAFDPPANGIPVAGPTPQPNQRHLRGPNATQGMPRVVHAR